MIEVENVIPIRKSDQFVLFTGSSPEAGKFIEKERVGVAYLKSSSSVFRLRLWMLPRLEYFLARNDDSHLRYLVLCREEYETEGGNRKSQWHRIGVGETIGNLIRIQFHLWPEPIYLCLFPARSKSEELLDAA